MDMGLLSLVVSVGELMSGPCHRNSIVAMSIISKQLEHV